MISKQIGYGIYKKDFVIAIIIILLPFMFYSYLLIPTRDSITIFNVKFLFTEGWDMRYVIWFFYTKIMIFFIFSLWFLTCQHWWRHAILATVYMSIRHIYALIIFAKDDLNEQYFSELECTLIAFPILLLLIYFSRKLSYYNSDKKTRKDLFHDIQKLVDDSQSFNRTTYNIHLEDFERLIKARHKKTRKEYMINLLELISKFKMQKNDNNK